MGKRGPIGDDQGHRDHIALVPAPGPGGAPARRRAPKAPTDLLPHNRAAWTTYWKSDVAQVAEDVDLPAVRRLFELYDQRDRAFEIVRSAGLVVKGSVGQVRTNPLIGAIAQLEPIILRLENELGLTPHSRARLGIAVGEEAMTAEKLNEMARNAGRGQGAPAGDGDIIDTELADEFEAG